LKKKIGGLKFSPPPIVPSTSGSDSIQSPEPKRGLKRTIGGARAAVTAQSVPEMIVSASKESIPPATYPDIPDRGIHLHSGNANPSNIPAEHDDDDEIAAAEAKADEKRRTLKKELEQNAKPKPKKRRF
jgi:hypothetical protein